MVGNEGLVGIALFMGNEGTPVAQLCRVREPHTGCRHSGSRLNLIAMASYSPCCHATPDRSSRDFARPQPVTDITRWTRNCATRCCPGRLAGRSPDHDPETGRQYVGRAPRGHYRRWRQIEEARRDRIPPRPCHGAGQTPGGKNCVASVTPWSRKKPITCCRICLRTVQSQSKGCARTWAPRCWQPDSE